MGEFAGGGTYEVLTSSMQRDRLFAVDLDSGLGRSPAPVPPHLSRALYVPRHSMLNLSLREAGEQYRRAVDHSPFGGEHVTGKPAMGTRLFKTRLNTMTCPDGGADAAYSVVLDVEKIRDGGDISATVRRGGQPNATPHVTIILPMLTDVFSLVCVGSDDADADADSTVVDVDTRYPLPSLATNVGALHFPYFRFALALALQGEARQYEWQIHPLEHGTLRYTLMELDSPAEDAAGQQAEGRVRAIYHHVGYHGSLFLAHSEGVLLLPAVSDESGSDMQLEAVVVATLVGLLWRIRGMEIKNEPGGVKRRSFLRRVFGRR